MMAIRMNLRGLAVLAILISEFTWPSSANFVFQVNHKFKGRRRTLEDLLAHDAARHGRTLSGVQFGLGGTHLLDRLYWTKLTIGTPPVEYPLMIDTGSFTLWLNCHDCEKCPREGPGYVNNLYNPRKSNTSKLVHCGMKHCRDERTYDDGTLFSGYYVTDILRYGKVSGNFKTEPQVARIKFGCSRQDPPNNMDATIGVLGLDKGKSSIIQQLAKQGLTKRTFSHCLDSLSGGGIFAIGELVEPKVNSTPMLDYGFYGASLEAIDVAGELLEFPAPKAAEGRKSKAPKEKTIVTMLDSGATGSYLPEPIYEQLISKIKAWKPQIKYEQHPQHDITCFNYAGKIEEWIEDFPNITFRFKKSVTLTAFPWDYIIPIQLDKYYCIYWFRHQDTAIKLGDSVLSNKLVVYDLENKQIGMADYNCSAHITVKDEKSGSVFSVAAENLDTFPAAAD